MSNSYVLYVIEHDDAEADESGELVPALACRYDEKGEGSPLVWTERKPAEDLVRDIIRDTGIYGNSRVIELTFSARLPEPCPDCELYGPPEEHPHG